MSKLAEIKQYGQKVWLDNLSRELLQSGQLSKLIQEDNIAGVTSNPSIFHKAIANDKLYTNDLQRVKNSDLTPEARYEELVIPDIKQACDIMLPQYQSSNKEDGYVSFELAPYLANDLDGTVNNAKRLWKLIDRPNLMIKIPATKAGLLALTELISFGININITLLFSLEQVYDTWDAYIAGLNKRLEKGLSVDNIKSVASLFLSRVDSAIDQQLPDNLQGFTAITIAKKAYIEYQKLFNGDKFAKLKNAGAKGQYLLWASTGTKNPKYSDLLYVEPLIGKETINTMPDATMNAFRDHGKFDAVLQDCSEETEIASKTILADIRAHGVNLKNLGKKLQQDGLKLFEDSFNQLIDLVK